MIYQAAATAIIETPSKIGDDTKIWNFCHIMSGTKIGKNCVLGQNVHVASGAIIGNNVKIQNNVSIYDGVIIEDDVFLGPSCVFTNVTTPRSAVNRHDDYALSKICRGATIGANATILPGVIVKEYAFVAAGAVVTKHVEPHVMVAGVPAKPIGYACKCGLKLPVHAMLLKCIGCGAAYDPDVLPLKEL